MNGCEMLSIMSRSEKYKEFTSERMGEKSVRAVAGIGPLAQVKLGEYGYTEAYHLLGQFLLMNKEEMFKDCYDCLMEWTENEATRFPGGRHDPKRSDAQKHRDFIRESIGDKGITEIAGVGPRAHTNLEDKGFTKAYHLLGQFLSLDKDEGGFQRWLDENVSVMSSFKKKECYDCIAEWCGGHL
jgi:hypothetical protein